MTDQEKVAAAKQAAVLELLAGGSAFVVLDPRRPGVEVPEYLRGGPDLVLELGYDMAVPIPDLAVDERGIVATLSFNQAPYRCVIPWASVYVVHDGQARGLQFPEDTPPDSPMAKRKSEPPPAEPPKKPRPSHLKLVK